MPGEGAFILTVSDVAILKGLKYVPRIQDVNDVHNWFDVCVFSVSRNHKPATRHEPTFRHAPDVRQTPNVTHAPDVSHAPDVTHACASNGLPNKLAKQPPS